MGIISRKILAAGTAALLLCGIAACGGGGSPTPTEPTATYGGAATVGDIYVIEMDYPSTGKATVIRSATDGTLVGSRELTYTNTGNKYTFTDSSSNQFTGLIVPDSFFAMQLPDATEKDIIIAVLVNSTVTTTAALAAIVDNKDYLITQFRHDEKGVKWVRSNIAADGAITGHHANNDGALVPPAVDLDDVSTTNDFDPGMNVNDAVYNATTLGFTLTVADEIWTFYYTNSGMGVIDKGPLKGIRFNTIQGTSSNPADYGITNGSVYNAIFYGSHSETENGTSVGTVTVTEVGADYFKVTVAPETGEAPQDLTVIAATSDLWRGFFQIEGANAVVQPVGTSAIVFAGKQGPWNYNYGVAVK